jgi:hypothetical protein
LGEWGDEEGGTHAERHSWQARGEIFLSHLVPLPGRGKL